MANDDTEGSWCAGTGSGSETESTVSFEKWTQSKKDRERETEVTYSSRTAMTCENSECPESPVTVFAVTCRELHLGMKTMQRKADQGKRGQKGSLDPAMPEAEL